MLEGIQTSRSKRFRAMQAKDRFQPPASDLVKRTFEVTVPNKVWVGDMTAIRTKEGWVHLAVVLDLFARRIVGWAMDETQVVALPTAALQMAIVQRRPAAGLIFHNETCSGGPLMDCDEYPFAASQKGGIGYRISLRSVNSGENRGAGSKLRWFLPALQYTSEYR